MHRDLLSRLSWRWPGPCYVVATRSGGRALVVTEDNSNKSLARLCAYHLDTINTCIRNDWIAVAPVGRVPPYSGGKAGDSQAGQRVWITTAGCVELGVATPSQRRVMAQRKAASGADAEIRSSADGVGGSAGG